MIFPSAVAALESWKGTDFEEVLGDLVKILQDILELRRERMMLSAHVPPELAKEILESSPWPEAMERRVCRYISNLLAKLANQAELPVAYKDEIFGGVALLMILHHEIRLERRMEIRLRSL